jgi:uncharacterized membrane protein
MYTRELSWIGFWPLPPPTTDIVPFFPWFGVVLVGIAATGLGRASAAWNAVAGLRLDGPAGRSLRWLGRWSLLVYLFHQPLIYGVLEFLRQVT